MSLTPEEYINKLRKRAKNQAFIQDELLKHASEMRVLRGEQPNYTPPVKSEASDADMRDDILKLLRNTLLPKHVQPVFDDLIDNDDIPLFFRHSINFMNNIKGQKNLNTSTFIELWNRFKLKLKKSDFTGIDVLGNLNPEDFKRKGFELDLKVDDLKRRVNRIHKKISDNVDILNENRVILPKPYKKIKNIALKIFKVESEDIKEIESELLEYKKEINAENYDLADKRRSNIERLITKATQDIRDIVDVEQNEFYEILDFAESRAKDVKNRANEEKHNEIMFEIRKNLRDMKESLDSEISQKDVDRIADEVNLRNDGKLVDVDPNEEEKDLQSIETDKNRLVGEFNLIKEKTDQYFNQLLKIKYPFDMSENWHKVSKLLVKIKKNIINPLNKTMKAYKKSFKTGQFHLYTKHKIIVVNKLDQLRQELSSIAEFEMNELQGFISDIQNQDVKNFYMTVRDSERNSLLNKIKDLEKAILKVSGVRPLNRDLRSKGPFFEDVFEEKENIIDEPEIKTPLDKLRSDSDNLEIMIKNGDIPFDDIDRSREIIKDRIRNMERETLMRSMDEQMRGVVDDNIKLMDEQMAIIGQNRKKNKEKKDKAIVSEKKEEITPDLVQEITDELKLFEGSAREYWTLLKTYTSAEMIKKIFDGMDDEEKNGITWVNLMIDWNNTDPDHPVNNMSLNVPTIGIDGESWKNRKIIRRLNRAGNKIFKLKDLRGSKEGLQKRLFWNRYKNQPKTLSKILRGRGLITPDKPNDFVAKEWQYDEYDTPKDKQRSDNYAKFGKYLIHIPSLNNGYINLKYKSYSKIKNFPKKIITSKVQNLIKNILKNGEFSQTSYDKLSKSDKKQFDQIIEFSKLADEEARRFLNYKSQKSEDRDKDIQRFELLKGEIMSGNNNPVVIQELKMLVLKLANDGNISKKDFNDIMYLLAFV